MNFSQVVHVRGIIIRYFQHVIILHRGKCIQHESNSSAITRKIKKKYYNTNNIMSIFTIIYALIFLTFLANWKIHSLVAAPSVLISSMRSNRLYVNWSQYSSKWPIWVRYIFLQIYQPIRSVYRTIDKREIPVEDVNFIR